MNKRVAHILFFLTLAPFLNGDYNRIISLVPSITQELYLLNHQANLIGCTTFCRTPSAAKQKQKIGNVINLNIEMIMSLEPDLLLAGDYTSQKYMDLFDRFQIPVVIFKTPSTFNEIMEGFLKLARIIKKEPQARQYLEELNLRMKDIRDPNRNFPRVPVCFLLGTNPLYWATGESYLNDCIEFAGGINLLKNRTNGQVSREEILRLRPQVIIMADMGPGTRVEKSHWQVFNSLPAARNNQLYIVDPDIFCLPSPENFYLSVLTLRRILTGSASRPR